MTREQMFGTLPRAATSIGSRLVLDFDSKPREVPAEECGPHSSACILHRINDLVTVDWRYDLCPNHQVWYWSAT